MMNLMNLARRNQLKLLLIKIPLIGTNEAILNKNEYAAHDAYVCIGQKSYVNEKVDLVLENHYFMVSKELSELLKIFLTH